MPLPITTQGLGTHVGIAKNGSQIGASASEPQWSRGRVEAGRGHKRLINIEDNNLKTSHSSSQIHLASSGRGLLAYHTPASNPHSTRELPTPRR